MTTSTRTDRARFIAAQDDQVALHWVGENGEAERAFATTLEDVKECLRGSWAEDESRASPGYAVLRDARQVASITINTDQTETSQHVVRLILFLRSTR